MLNFVETLASRTAKFISRDMDMFPVTVVGINKIGDFKFSVDPATNRKVKDDNSSNSLTVYGVRCVLKGKIVSIKVRADHFTNVPSFINSEDFTSCPINIKATALLSDGGVATVDSKNFKVGDHYINCEQFSFDISYKQTDFASEHGLRVN